MAAALSVAFCVAAFLAGCDRAGIQVHEIPKGVEGVPPDESAGAAPPDPDFPRHAADRPWSVPEGWAEDFEPRQMRLATYIVPDPAGPVEVAVSRFGGRVGGELANINRWRGQMGLAPIRVDEPDAVLVRFSSPGHEGYATRIESPDGVMLAAGVYDEAIQQTWFVRAILPDGAAADRLQEEIFGLARSIAAKGE